MQHDYNIGSGDSKTGLQVRADINGALAAIKSSNSGTAAPSTPVVGMRWFNETNSISYEYTSAGWKAIANETSVNAIVSWSAQPFVTAASNSAIAAAGSASSALSSANNSQLSATQAQTAANLATAVVIPTTATYSYTQQDWRDSMMSKAEFGAMAAERRTNRAGSGFDEFGKSASGYSVINEGLWTAPTLVNLFAIGTRSDQYTGAIGTSKTQYPVSLINGVNHKIDGINDTSGTRDLILLPPAPTVLPFGTVLTQQQIDSGVIKHADASNSGLIVNGKFDTDTSGWVAIIAGSSITTELGWLKVEQSTGDAGRAEQIISTVVGKSYTLEADLKAGTSPTYIRVANSSNASIADSVTVSSTSSTRVSITFTATQSTHKVWIILGSVTDNVYSYADNIAVFPADAISRSDLAFLESWHEDVSEKDFVYPLGNVQYLGTTGDSGTPVVGAFAGAATYSLFSDTWQADSALVGKGYVWSTLSDANKKAFVVNPENNCYLDGDKVIQVRYRMRVVMGLGDSWANVSTQINTAPTTGAISYVSYNSGAVVAKGKQVASADFGSYNTVSTYWGSYNTTKVGFDSGIAYSFKASTPTDLLISYDGTSLLLPIALVHRRNQGMYHPVYNPNGTKLASDSLPWYSTTVSFASIADCFTESKLLATSGYIGTTTGRADTLFYDQIHEGDITDLRMSSKVPTDYNRLIDREFNKLVAGTYRGTEGERGIVKRTLEVADYSGQKTIYDVGGGIFNLRISNTLNSYFPNDTIYFGRDSVSGYVTAYVKVVVVGDTGVGYLQVVVVNNSTSPSILPSGTGVLYSDCNMYKGAQSTRTKSNTLTHTDIIGSPANYPLAWKQSGVSGTPLIVAEDGTSLLPTGTTGSDGLATFKLSRKANATPLQVLKSTDSGVTWAALTVTTHYTFSTTTNAITFTAGNIPLTTDLVRVTYQTHTNMATATVNSEVLAIGDVYADNVYLGAALGQSLIGKVLTAGGNGWKSKITDYLTLSSGLIYNSYPPKNINGIFGVILTAPAVKIFPYLTRSNGKAYLNLVFKEMKYGSYAAPTVVTAASATYTINMTYKINIAGCALDGKVIQWTAATATVAIDWSLYDVSPTEIIYLLSSGAVYANARLYDGDSWGDDAKFNIVDNVSTTTDTNGATVLIGQKRVELPYFIGAGE